MVMRNSKRDEGGYGSSGRMSLSLALGNGAGDSSLRYSRARSRRIFWAGYAANNERGLALGTTRPQPVATGETCWQSLRRLGTKHPEMNFMEVQTPERRHNPRFGPLFCPLK